MFIIYTEDDQCYDTVDQGIFACLNFDLTLVVLYKNNVREILKFANLSSTQNIKNITRSTVCTHTIKNDLRQLPCHLCSRTIKSWAAPYV